MGGFLEERYKNYSLIKQNYFYPSLTQLTLELSCQNFWRDTPNTFVDI